MDLQTMTYFVVGATFLLYIGIAIKARAGSTGEFYVAGGGVNPIANGMATAADWMSAASFIGMAGLIAFSGYGGSVFLMGWTGGYVLLAMLLAPYLRKFGKFTVPEFIGDRYYCKTARLVAVVCLLLASITYVIGQMKGVGVSFSRFLDVDYSVGLIIGMAIVFVYAVLGGMKGVTYTQIAQYVVLIFAYTVPAIFISFNLTGNPIPQLGLGSTIGENTFFLDKLDQVVTDLGFKEYTTNVLGSKLNMFAYTLTLMIGTAGLPHVIIRFFTVPKVKDARLSAGWALVFIAILYTTAPAVAAMAFYNLTSTLQPGEIGSADGNLKVEDRPQWFSNWEKTGLLRHNDKNKDGRIQYYNDQNQEFAEKAASYGWEGSELEHVPFSINGETKPKPGPDRDIIVLANPEIANLPNWVIALVVAGGLAAALSTAAGLLLAISSAVSHDLLKGVFKPDISEKEELMWGRISMAVAIAVAGFLGLRPPAFAAGTVALAFGLAASSLFPVLMMGIFYKKMNRQGAIAGMIAGIGVTLLYVFQHHGVMFIKGTEFLGSMEKNWFLGIDPKAFGVVGAIVNFIVAMIVCKMTPPPPKEVQDLVESIRIPKGSAAPNADH